MIIRIKLFAAARDLTDRSEISLEIPPASTVDFVRESIGREYPSLAPLARHAMIAVNNDYADGQTVVEQGNEIALIPPVSGG